jgi:hypothetical protein
MPIFSRGKNKPVDPEALSEAKKVRFWRNKVTAALSMRQDDEDDAKKFTDVYHARARQVTPNIGEIENMNTHYGHKFVDELVTKLTFRDPRWNVLNASSAPRAKDTASIVRGHLAWYMYNKRVREDVSEPVILDAILCGSGISEIGFKVPNADYRKPTEDEKRAAELELAAAAAGSDIPMSAIEAAVEEIANQGQDLPAPTDGVDLHTDDEVFLQYVDWWDFLVAPGYKSIEQAWSNGGWVAKRIVLPLLVARNDPRYRNKDDIQPTREINSPQYAFLKGDDLKVSERISGSQDDNLQFAVLWQIHTAPDFSRNKPGKVYVISDGCEKFHFKGEHPYPMVNGFPYRSLVLKKRKGKFNGMPFLKHMIETLDEYDRLRSTSLDIAKMMKPILLALRGIWDEQSIRDLSQTSAGQIKLVKSLEGIQALQYDFDERALASEISRTEADMFFKGNIGPNQAGTFGNPGASATEVSVIQQNLQSDIQSFSQRIDTWWVDAGRDYVKLLKAFGDPGKILVTANQDGKSWNTFRIDEISEEVDIRIGSGAALPVSEDVKRKQLLDMIVTFNSTGRLRTGKIMQDYFEAYTDLPSPQDYVINDEDRDQHLETLVMLREGEVAPVLPTDAHIDHINKIDLVRNPMLQTLQAIQQGQAEMPQEEIERTFSDVEILGQHRDMHVAFLGEDPASQGPDVNAVRAAMADRQQNEGQMMAAAGGEQ